MKLGKPVTAESGKIQAELPAAFPHQNRADFNVA